MKCTSTLSSCFVYGVFGLLFRVHDMSKMISSTYERIWTRRSKVDICGVSLLIG